MKDIFFTDGDAALTSSHHSSRAIGAIRSRRRRLGLGLFEEAGNHINGARRFNSEVSNLSGAGELTNITRQLTHAEDSLRRCRPPPGRGKAD